MPFQTVIALQQAPAVAGDFASNNPRSSVLGPEAGFVAGAAGAIVARFAWLDPADSTGRSIITTNSGSAVPLGFIANNEQALITTYLAEFGLVIPGGFGVTVYAMGDYWVNVTVATATAGQKAFAKSSDGTMQPGAAGATIAGYVETPFFISVGAAVGALAIMSQI